MTDPWWQPVLYFESFASPFHFPHHLDEDVTEQDQLVRWIHSPCYEHLTNVNAPSVPYVCHVATDVTFTFFYVIIVGVMYFALRRDKTLFVFSAFEQKVDAQPFQ